ncbi:hypothetical protein JZM25_25115 [Escherichia coli]|uniref:hypothetical protein n=1 Tax=Escherichia coli TaxID=562 RepID=UPI0019D0500F|nr:hypothetical protein [Escherichia coli]MBN6398526.1 hypothetical protein [Escherichia coli]
MFRNLIVTLFSAIIGIGIVIPDSLAQYTEISTNQYNLESRITANTLTESKDVSCGSHICNAIFFEICLPGNNFCNGDNIFKWLELPNLDPNSSYKVKTGDVDVTLNMKLSGGSAEDKYQDKTCAITFKILDSGQFNMTMTEPTIDWPPESPDNQYHLNK